MIVRSNMQFGNLYDILKLKCSIYTPKFGSTFWYCVLWKVVISKSAVWKWAF